MAVIQDEQGNNKPIKTDTSHVFDMNGNPLHGELFIGETIASDDVEEIDGYAHESEVAEINSNLTQLRPDGIGVITSLTTSAKEGTLIDDAFSNYDMIIIVADDTGDARRASMVLPMASFVASSNNILTFLAGGQTFTMSVKYKTDTKFEAYLSASTSGLGITMQCKVYGMMHK